MERIRGVVMSRVAPRKSSGRLGLGMRVMVFMRGCDVEAVLKCDSEPVLTKVVEEIGRLRAAMWKAALCTRARATDSSRGRSRACRAGEDVEESGGQMECGVGSGAHTGDGCGLSRWSGG